MNTKAFGVKLENQVYIRREGVYGISFSDDNKVALVKVPYGYFLPGGGIEDDEDHESCLKREFMEEIGQAIKLIRFVGCLSQYTFSHKTKRYIELVGYFYIVEIKGSVGGKVEDDHELEWRDIKDVPQIMNLEYQAHIIIEAYDEFG